MFEDAFGLWISRNRNNYWTAFVTNLLKMGESSTVSS